jgi:hypothetical protein
MARRLWERESGQQLQQQPVRREAVAWSRELRRTEVIKSLRKAHGLKNGPEMQKPHQRDVLNAAKGGS